MCVLPTDFASWLIVVGRIANLVHTGEASGALGKGCSIRILVDLPRTSLPISPVVPHVILYAWYEAGY